MAWLANYTRRRKVTVAAAKVDALLADTPVLFAVDNDATIGAVCLANGHDLRVTRSDGTTLLPFERELWSVAAGQLTARVWFLSDALSAITDTEFYVYYGHTAASDGEDAAATWFYYSHVCHMGTTLANATGADITLADTGTADAAGIFDRARDFEDTEGDYLTYGGGLVSLVNYGTQWFECWVKPESLPGALYALFIANRRNTNAGTFGLAIQNGTNKFFGQCRLAASPTIIRSCASNVAAVAGNWYHVVLCYDGDELAMYVNGVKQTSTDGTNGLLDTASFTSYHLGRHPATVTNYYDGLLDEVRVSSIVCSASYAKLQYNLGTDYANTVQVAAEEVLVVGIPPQLLMQGVM